MSSLIAIKANYQGEDIRRFSIAHDATFADVQKSLLQTFGKLGNISWQDEEGDIITIRTEQDWKEAIKGRPTLLRLTLNGTAEFIQEKETKPEEDQRTQPQSSPTQPQPSPGSNFTLPGFEEYLASMMSSQRFPTDQARQETRPGSTPTPVPNPPIVFGMGASGLSGMDDLTKRISEVAVEAASRVVESLGSSGVIPDMAHREQSQREQSTEESTEEQRDGEREEATSPTSEAGEATNEPAGTSNLVHRGIICDVCNKPIVGVRFKCLERSDYDLCSSCIQPDESHIMLRIPRPLDHPSRYLSKVMRATQHFRHKSASNGERAERGARGGKGRRCQHPHPHHHHHQHPHSHPHSFPFHPPPHSHHHAHPNPCFHPMPDFAHAQARQPQHRSEPAKPFPASKVSPPPVSAPPQYPTEVTPAGTILPTAPVSKNNFGPGVVQLNRLLVKLKVMNEEDLTRDDLFGSATENAIKNLNVGSSGEFTEDVRDLLLRLNGEFDRNEASQKASEAAAAEAAESQNIEEKSDDESLSEEEESTPEPELLTKYPDALNQIVEMGFLDLQAVINALEKHNGSVEQSVMELLTQRY
eukprot:m.147361 g.147361  ORF g.147361 m.147361 type:complete len:585 (-) comp14986_c1_seq1:134-1888(-)